MEDDRIIDEVVAAIELCVAPIMECDIIDARPGVTKYGSSCIIDIFDSIEEAVEAFWEMPGGYVYEHDEGEFYAVEYRLRFFSKLEKRDKAVYSCFDGSIVLDNNVPSVLVAMVDIW